jgi:hypothetical protein
MKIRLTELLRGVSCKLDQLSSKGRVFLYTSPEPLGPSLVASAQGVKDFTKARGKAKIKFYSVSQGGKGPDTRDSIGHVG